MKTLETEFVNGVGGFPTSHRRYTQLKRTPKVGLYKRTVEATGKIEGYEVFSIKVKPKGTRIFQQILEEDEEVYPSSEAHFGKSAWFVVDEKRANELFDSLVKTGSNKPEHPEVVEAPTVDEEEGEEEPITPVRVARVKKSGEVMLKLPEKPFTQKELASFNKIENYKAVYSDLQKMLNSGVLKIVGSRPGVKRPAKLFGRA